MTRRFEVAAYLRLSVPSSSGSGLQLCDAHQLRGDGVGLSVPSSSGSGLQPTVVVYTTLNCYHLSVPLLIGERSATRFSNTDRLGQLHLSVPSSSGSGLRWTPKFRQLAKVEPAP